MTRRKKFAFTIGQTILIVKDIVRDNGESIREYLGAWDVVEVNKKRVVLQNWPTYEQRVIKL